MKKLILLILVSLAGEQAWSVEVLVPVESKTGNRYVLQILVPGSKPAESEQMTEIIKRVVPEISKTYSTVWLLDHRQVIMDRLEKEFKQAKLYCDGVGVLRLRMQGTKILDVE